MTLSDGLCASKHRDRWELSPVFALGCRKPLVSTWWAIIFGMNGVRKQPCGASSGFSYQANKVCKIALPYSSWDCLGTVAPPWPFLGPQPQSLDLVLLHGVVHLVVEVEC